MDAAGGHAHPVLVIVPIDEAGAAPPLVGGGDLDLPEQLRGHEFLLVVEAGGQCGKSSRPTPDPAQGASPSGSARPDVPP